ncbi:MAG TPA: sigma-54 dependent transcriptional regulator [Saprospiraceae bacterium]|nr:sigma-54 dependent transcriptional regulator [Saprospiraceae bacterium]HMQ82819.1 sigma-54 dependent transcriptional regulator [Saprospiraceae bacterium]
MPESKKILIIDDDLAYYDAFTRQNGHFFKFFTEATEYRGLDLVEKGQYDAVLLDLDFRGQGYQHGLEHILPNAVKNAAGRFPIIVCTSDEKKNTHQRALGQGAYDLLRKSEYHPIKWQEQISQLIENFRNPRKKVIFEEAEQDGFITRSESVMELKKRLKILPAFNPNATLLFLGETGVGKEVAVNYLHQAKGQKKAPFVPVNLSGVKDSLLESELFGHVKGAFTDAGSEKIGYFEKAGEGTLFLDEIGEIGPDIQVKLLRVLQEREFAKVGDTRMLPLKAQLVFATNVDLEQAIEQGTFRRDFYERISPMTFYVPPLRERREDIIPLINFFLKQEEVCPNASTLFGKNAEEAFSPAALSKLHFYHWPGNIRELRNVLQKVVFELFVAGQEIIDENLLPERFNQKQASIVYSAVAVQHKIPNNSPAYEHTNWPIHKQTAYDELLRIEKALIDSGGKKDEAARVLGLKNDQTLRYKVQKKYFEQYPDLFTFFPTVKKVYKL